MIAQMVNDDPACRSQRTPSTFTSWCLPGPPPLTSMPVTSASNWWCFKTWSTLSAGDPFSTTNSTSSGGFPVFSSLFCMSFPATRHTSKRRNLRTLNPPSAPRLFEHARKEVTAEVMKVTFEGNFVH